MVAKLSTTINKIQSLPNLSNRKYEMIWKHLEDMNKQLSEMMLMIQHNPKLSYIKSEILEKINENQNSWSNYCLYLTKFCCL